MAYGKQYIRLSLKPKHKLFGQTFYYRIIFQEFGLNVNSIQNLSKSHLNQHKNSVHLNVRFICDFNECNKSFTEKSNLFRHKSCVHLNDRKFKCNEENCGKSFVQKADLIRHKRIHLGEKPFVCHFNDCNKTFSDKSNFNQHMTMHKFTNKEL
ncbi:unnamed protein product [Medioppia subpectinata]|uniref:C2H2-type domain-containing protein n=1 Tax=Medioppia subpectinata TaxID=1979941 RepID=A0A7R9LB23_9ACAR|nr:unnamed protein product [Medioppia subpectinata]CAG2117399.1 unnamed protein product [Medioppia subpectinata]